MFVYIGDGGILSEGILYYNIFGRFCPGELFSGDYYVPDSDWSYILHTQTSVFMREMAKTVRNFLTCPKRPTVNPKTAERKYKTVHIHD